MVDLNEQLENLTVEIACEYCKAIYNIRLTGFGGTYICECRHAIRASSDEKITICRA